MGHGDLSLEFRFQEIVPGGRIGQPLFLEPFGVAGEGNGTDIEGIRESRLVVEILRDILKFGRLVGFEKSRLAGWNEIVERTAEPDGCLRIVLFRSYPGQELPGRKTDALDLDAGILLEFCIIRRQFHVGERRVYGEGLVVALCCRLDQR